MTTELRNKINYLIKDNQNPENLYKNIKNSTGPDEKLAELFNVPLEVVREIRSEKEEIKE